MARPIRIEMENGCYHVVARGNERQNIFRTDEDRNLFIKTCEQMVEQFGLVVHAYCLMPNHYHLVVSTPRANLSQSIGWLQTTYTIRFNRKYSRSGHLYQGRFKAHVVEADEYAHTLIPYVHLNPVRPRDKKAKIDPDRFEVFEQYRWSSHWDYTGKRKQSWVNLDWLSYWGNRPKKARRQYIWEMREYFGEIVKSPWDDLKGELLLGSEAFVEAMKKKLEKKSGKDETRWISKARKEKVQGRVEDLIREEDDVRIQMWILGRIGGWRMVDIARRYDYTDGSGVLHVLQRIELNPDKSIQKKIKQLKEMSIFKS